MRLSLPSLAAASLVVSTLASCSGGTGGRSDERAVITGRVKLHDRKARDFSRVRVDIGRGEGGVVPDTDGNFELSDIEPDTYNLVVTYVGGLTLNATGSAYARHETRVVARAGSSIALGEIPLELARGAVEGTVRLDDGSSSDGTEVVLETDEGTTHKTDVVAGAFRFENIVVGNHKLSLNRAGYAVPGAGISTAAAAACGRAVTVSVGEEVVPAGSLSLASKRIGFAPGGLETQVVTPDTWLLTGTATGTTIRATTGFAVEQRYILNNATTGDGGLAAYEPYDSEGKTFDNLPAGMNVVKMQFKDPCGYEVDPPLVLNIANDLVDPVVALVVLGDGAPFTRTQQLNMTVFADDDLSPTLQMRYLVCRVGSSAADGCDATTPAWNNWQGYESQRTIDLGSTPGALRVRVQVKDWRDHESEIVDTDVTLDATAPVVSPFTVTPATTREPSMVASLSITEAVSSTVRVLVTDVQPDCANATYAVTLACTSGTCSGNVPFVLGPTDGPHSLFACAMDEAGNANSPVGASAPVTLDTTPPDPGTLTLAGGAAATNATDRTVSLQLTGGATGMRVLIAGTIEPLATNPVDWASVPATVTLTSGDGEKVVSALLLDGAGNASVPFSDAIMLDTQAPELGNLVLANNQAVVTQTVVPVSINGTSADRVAVWENTDATSACTARACSDAAFQDIRLLSTFRFPDPVQSGEHRVCWQTCDLAGNPSGVDHRDVELGTFRTRPVPVLEELQPPSIVALSSPTGSYSLTVAGRDIAGDTKVQIGDFTLSCVSVGATDCALAGDGGASACATSCTVQNLPREISERSGTYVVRLVTPAPVVDGVGISAVTRFLNVVAPIPRISSVSLRGVVQPRDGEAPDAGGQLGGGQYRVDVCVSYLMENGQFTLGPNYAALDDSVADPFERPAPTGACPNATDALVHLVVHTDGLAPDDLQDERLVASNSPPGGGDDAVPFGLNPTVTGCPAFGPCFTNLRSTRPERWDGQGVQQPLRLTSTVPWGGIAHSGATAAMARGAAPAPSSTVRTSALAGLGHMQLPFLESTEAVTLENKDNSGLPVSLLPSGERPTGIYCDATQTDRATCFAESRRTWSPSASFNDYVPVDLDADGAMDVVAIATTGNLFVAMGTNIVAAPTARGSEDSTRRVAYPVPGGAAALGAADMDMDGRPDVVVATTDGTVITYRNVGRGQLEQGSGVAMGPCPLLRLADLNVDGYPDVVCRNADLVSDAAQTDANSPDSILVRPGLPKGKLGALVTVKLATNAPTLEIMDWNHDHKPDLLSLNAAGTAVVLHGNGDATFGAPVVLGCGTGQRLLSVADMNADGAPDVMTYGGMDDNDQVEPLEGTFRICLNRGDGTIAAPLAGGWDELRVENVTMVGQNLVMHNRAITVWDADGDPFPDVLYVLNASNPEDAQYAQIAFNTLGKDIGAAEKNPLGKIWFNFFIGFTTPMPTPAPAHLPCSKRFVRVESLATPAEPPLRIADFNGDGAPDISCPGETGIEVYFARRPARLLAPSAGTGIRPVRAVDETGKQLCGEDRRVVTADFNRDGIPETVVSGSRCTETSGQTINSSVRLELHRGLVGGSGDSPVGPVATFNTLAKPGALLGVADMNNDGIPDVVQADTSWRNRFNGEYLQGPIRITPGRITGGQPDLDVAGQIVVGSSTDNTSSLVLVDLDADGRTDILAAMSDLRIARHYNNGNGTFTRVNMSSNFPWSPAALAAGDINNDGKVDIAALTTNGTVLRVFMGNDPLNRVFDEPTNLTIPGDNALALELADMDNDGRLDAIIGAVGEVRVFTGAGDGTFTLASTLPGTVASMEFTQGTFSVADLNQDRRRDVLLSDRAGNRLLVALGRGDGTFAAAVPVSAPAPEHVVVSDINGNGTPEILATSDRDLLVLGLPTRIRELQELPLLPSASVSAASASYSVNTASANVESVSVRVRMSGPSAAELAGISVRLQLHEVLSDGTLAGSAKASALLNDSDAGQPGCQAGGPGGATWLAHYTPTTSCESLAPFLGFHGRTRWTVVVDAPSGTSAQLEDVTLILRSRSMDEVTAGRTNGFRELREEDGIPARRGLEAPVTRFPAGSTGLVVSGDTFGLLNRDPRVTGQSVSSNEVCGWNYFRAEWNDIEIPESGDWDFKLIANMDATLYVLNGGCNTCGSYVSDPPFNFPPEKVTLGTHPAFTATGLSAGRYCAIILNPGSTGSNAFGNPVAVTETAGTYDLFIRKL